MDKGSEVGWQFSIQCALREKYAPDVDPDVYPAAVQGLVSLVISNNLRPQRGKEMPSGHIPSDAMEHPELLAGKSCLISVPKEAVQDLRVLLMEEVGAKENFTRWVSDEFQALADAAYVEIGSPSITFDNSWDVFKLIAAYLEDVLFA
ncbi:hypothetical protein C8J56DRAFT_1165555 [Mycena floridula]|nr:hypothetical protein C8J56DRAFT_1170367 [Mycena floridula]KAJ7586723.1 hypothetical protein C8J56DRAFT_1165555 [Mycena floridula]